MLAMILSPPLLGVGEDLVAGARGDVVREDHVDEQTVDSRRVQVEPRPGPGLEVAALAARAYVGRVDVGVAILDPATGHTGRPLVLPGLSRVGVVGWHQKV